jgi:uncharacterized membrane protein
MAGVTQDLLLEYIQRKGGRVKNVDLVKHFRKHLLFDDPKKKEQARETFKETVNSIAYIRQEDGEKFLYLKDDFLKPPSSQFPETALCDVTSPKVTSTILPSTASHPSHMFSDLHVHGQINHGSIDLHPESKTTTLQPKTVSHIAAQNDVSRLHNVAADSKSLLYSQAIPVNHSTRQPMVSSSLPSSNDAFQSNSHHLLYGASPSIRSSKKTALEISRPLNVQLLSNGTAMEDSSDLQKITDDLENFGRTGTFQDTLMSLHNPSVPSVSNHPTTFPSISVPTGQTSENVSSISGSNFPTSDQMPVTLSVTTLTGTPSRGSQFSNSRSGGGGVKALIQQYTGPSPQSSESNPSIVSTTTTHKVARSASSVSNHSINSLQIRREPTPPETRVQRSHSNVGGGVVIRRSKALDARSANLDTLTRQSIRVSSSAQQSHLINRLSRTSDELGITNSREELLSEDQDRESPIDEYVIEIDPIEKEWMMALINGNMDTLRHIVMSDSVYVNRKGFINGWTALHWAAKLGHEEIVVALLISGAKTDIKSHGGMTPLHIASEAGHYNIIRLLVEDYS